MPSFAQDESRPYPTTQSFSSATFSSATTTPTSADSETAFSKAVASKISGQALASVDLNGPRPLRYSPPHPTSPPPSPPHMNGDHGVNVNDNKTKIVDDRTVYYNPQRSPALTEDDAYSAASSADMNGHSNSSGRAASSQTTTGPADEDAAYYDQYEGRTHSLTKSISPDAPSRAPPPPPPSQKPPSAPQIPAPQRLSSSSLTPSISRAAGQTGRPDAPSFPPPPPPKPESMSRKAKSPNGGPISVPNPMALPDRTRVSPPQQQHAWINGTSAEETDEAANGADDAHPRHSIASNGASSILTSTQDVYGIRQINRGTDETTFPGSSSFMTAPSGSTGQLNTFGTSGASAPSTANPEPASSASSNHLSGPSANPQLLQAGGSPVPPHRFSSPPAYNPAAASASASSTHLSPAMGLKHRHTLEVPKVTPGRNSRDSQDTAIFTSGRFSPTTVGVGSGSNSVGGRRASLSLGRRNTRSIHSELPRDEVLPDEDALRWAEAYRQKRASKKRRMEQDDDQVLVGTKVDETHQNWVAAYNMLTGIRVSVSRTNAKLDRPLTDEDFEAKQKSTFDIAGNELVPSAKYDFKFKDYAPWVFRHLRSLFHLDPADYLMSLAGKYILSELGSPGKSGSFFYFSRDYRYIIKTIHHSEHKFLRKILKDYYKHVTENPNTLLSQFFGLHRVKMPYGRKIHFVVMNNLFPPHRDIHQTFDLKGSTIGRDYPEELLSDNPRATLKDLNWLRRHQHLELGIIKKRLFLEQLQKDVKLLQRLKIMDYSLLVGTHDLRRGNDENLRGKSLQVFEPRGDGKNSQEGPEQQSVLMRTPSKLEHQRKTRELRQMLKSERPIPIGESSNKMPDELDDNKQSIFYKDDGGFQATHQDNAPAEEVYYLGVIDCLTHYGMVKKIEHFWKGLSSDREKISALPPQQYGDRFLKFMSGITMSPEDAAREAQDRGDDAAAEAGVPAPGSNAPFNYDAQFQQQQQQQQYTQQHDEGLTMASGRATGSNWQSNMRHRSAASAHSHNSFRNSDSGDVTAYHRAAELEAQKGSPVNDTEATHTTVPMGSMVMPALVSGSADNGNGYASSAAPPIDRRESQQPALEIVDEAGESSSTGGRSQSSRLSTRTAESDGRPATPAKDGRYSNSQAPHQIGNLKPESADSGYGVSGSSSGRKVKVQMGRNSLEKDLPPLPPVDV